MAHHFFKDNVDLGAPFVCLTRDITEILPAGLAHIDRATSMVSTVRVLAAPSLFCRLPLPLDPGGVVALSSLSVWGGWFA